MALHFGCSIFLTTAQSFSDAIRLWEGPEGSIGIQDGCTILELYRHLLPNRKYSKESAFDNDRNYNNLCYAILAMIIEKITGRSWAEALDDKIFDPLGLT